MPDDNGMISKYKGPLTVKSIVNNIALIKKAFPSLPLEFYDILTDRLCEYDFCDDRFRDAVLNVIDTCIYPTPTIANFINYDKKIPCFNNVITNENIDKIR